MAPQKQVDNRLTSLFFEKKCWQIHELSDSLKMAVISVRRHLKRVGYFRSYTHNGKWYTLGSIPAFNTHGLWQYDDIGFSKHGTLTRTIEILVRRSAAGYSALELKNLLGTPCHAILTQMYKGDKIDRLKTASQFVYLSVDRNINRRQRQMHQDALRKTEGLPLSAEAAVLVLVEFINHPGISFTQIVANLKHKLNMVVKPDDIARLFEQHGIKKTSSDLKP